MIEVFKTNVEETVQAKKIVDLLLEHFPDNKINFDLHDCDKILRVEGKSFCAEKIMTLVTENGFRCNILE
ncbi:MAG TPA: hypothetical protein VGQ53_11600 [Chitinophagaceae bacterium]|jgi:hypothetical protein|nr:hypothetical protein [Chitinophagaceae bacterium]